MLRLPGEALAALAACLPVESISLSTSETDMPLTLVPPVSPRSSRVKVCAFLAFRVLRLVQARASLVPGVIAWRESASPNA